MFLEGSHYLFCCCILALVAVVWSASIVSLLPVQGFGSCCVLGELLMFFSFSCPPSQRMKPLRAPWKSLDSYDRAMSFCVVGAVSRVFPAAEPMNKQWTRLLFNSFTCGRSIFFFSLYYYFFTSQDSKPACFPQNCCHTCVVLVGVQGGKNVVLRAKCFTPAFIEERKAWFLGGVFDVRSITYVGHEMVFRAYCRAVDCCVRYLEHVCFCRWCLDFHIRRAFCARLLCWRLYYLAFIFVALIWLHGWERAVSSSAWMFAIPYLSPVALTKGSKCCCRNVTLV